jgi:hypothetical protein
MFFNCTPAFAGTTAEVFRRRDRKDRAVLGAEPDRQDEIRICLGLLGVISFAELTLARVTTAPAVGMPDIFSALPHAAE